MLAETRIFLYTGKMNSPLLATKLTIPPTREGNVVRARLVEKLDAGLDQRLILLSAPAGFGNTTLLAGWLRNLRSQKTAWLSLDEGDSDVVRFWSYFAAALQSIWPGVGREVPAMFGASRPVPAQSILTVLINEIAAEDSPGLLVLDDLHQVTDESVLQGLAFFVEHLPAPLTLVLSTRSDPPLPLARLRARGQLAEVRMTDLRFTDEETAGFLAGHGLPLSTADISALEARTEGWAAGLQMAALSLQGSTDASGFIRAFTGSNRYVLDYLLEEVLRREPADVQDFLKQTSILGRLCSGLCNAVTGRSDSQSLLERLEADNLFLIPLDQERRWYRYHALFAELLSAQLENDPACTAELHRHAAGWYAQNGDPAGAIGHALAARDFEQAASTLERTFLEFIGRSEIKTLEHWLRALPDETVRAHPWLCALDAWLLIIGGQAGAIEARLQQAESMLDRLPAADAGRIRGYAASIRAQLMFIQGAAPAAIQLAQQALGLLTPADFVIASTTAMILGAAYSYIGELDAAVPAFEQSKAISLAGGNEFNAMIASSALAQITGVRGRLHDAYQIYSNALHLTGEFVSLAPGYTYVGLADILREWNRLDEALEYATKGVEICELLGQADILMTGYIVLARIQRGRGDFSAALTTLEKARRVASEISAWSLDSVLLHQARVALVAGDPATAVRWAQESGYSPQEPASFHREAGLLTLARVLMAQGQRVPAGALLARIRDAALQAGRRSGEIEAGLLEALNFASGGETARARETLEGMLALSEPEGFTRIYLDEGEAAMTLLRQLAPSAAIVQRMALPHPTTGLINPLSDRELDVLRLLAAGRSNPEIADELVVSLNTVKAHVKSIFAKLGVHNRSQALLRAQEMKLL
jgi:LuxR family maltose regulon positive regulatory protein